MNKNKSFTLIELLISVTIFSIIIAIVSGIFVFSLKAQKKILITQQLLEQTSYLMEYMSRSIRMAKKDIAGDCLTTAGAKYNYETDGVQRNRIRFLNYRDKCQEFYLDPINQQIRERKSEDATAAHSSFLSSLPLTSTSTVEALSFNVGPSYSWQQPSFDYNQPRVTLFLEIKGKGENHTSIKIQTTISQRNLDFEL